MSDFTKRITFNICLRRVLGVRNGVTMRSGAINGGIPSARFLCLLQIPLPFPLPIHVPSEWLVIIWLCQLQTALRCILYQVKMCRSKSIFNDSETYLHSIVNGHCYLCIICKKLPNKKCNFSRGKKKVFSNTILCTICLNLDKNTSFNVKVHVCNQDIYIILTGLIAGFLFGLGLYLYPGCWIMCSLESSDCLS